MKKQIFGRYPTKSYELNQYFQDQSIQHPSLPCPYGLKLQNLSSVTLNKNIMCWEMAFMINQLSIVHSGRTWGRKNFLMIMEVVKVFNQVSLPMECATHSMENLPQNYGSPLKWFQLLTVCSHHIQRVIESLVDPELYKVTTYWSVS